MSGKKWIGLVGDVGGTNARISLCERAPQDQDGLMRLIKTEGLECSKYESIYTAINVYFEHIGERPELDFCAFAMAGPVKEGSIKLTNLPWTVTEDELKVQTGARATKLMNDYEGLAYSLPHLNPDDVHVIGTPARGAGDVYAVMGPGTGFGASVLVGAKKNPHCLSTESGHATFAPVDDIEADIHRVLRKKFGRVSIEHLLSGPGLVNIYHALCTLRNIAPLALNPSDVTSGASGHKDICDKATEVFIDILAEVCGDIGLYHGATAGVFIAGGITPRLMERINPQRFRARMEAKGPMTGYVSNIPVKVIIHKFAALIGAAHAISDAQLNKS